MDELYYSSYQPDEDGDGEELTADKQKLCALFTNLLANHYLQETA